MDKTSIVLKQDTLGRVHTPLERREALVAEFRRSGLSAVQFSKMVGVRYSTFWTWLKHHDAGSHSRRGRPGRKPKFVEVVMAQQNGGVTEPEGMLQITLPGGAMLSMASARQVPLAAQLLKALAPAC